MKKDTKYMRNSHNTLNESGTQMPNSRNVNIAHMDIKPLLTMTVTFFFMLLIMGIFGFVMVENQIQNLNIDIATARAKLEQIHQGAIPYVVHHEIDHK